MASTGATNFTGALTSNTLQSVSYVSAGNVVLPNAGIVGNATAATATVSSLDFSGIQGTLNLNLAASQLTTLFADGATITFGDGGVGTGLIDFDINSASTVGNTITVTSGAGNDFIRVSSATAVNYNINGGAGADTLVMGNTGANTIVGGLGADILTGGAGVDTYGSSNNFGASGQGVAATGAVPVLGVLAPTATITFANGYDNITNFAATDLADVVTAGVAPTLLNGAAANTVLAAGTTYVLYGTVAAGGVFTVNAAGFVAGDDALVVVGDGASTIVNTTGVVLMDNLGAALAAGKLRLINRITSDNQNGPRSNAGTIFLKKKPAKKYQPFPGEIHSLEF